MGRIPDNEVHKLARRKWNWEVRIDFIRYIEKEGVPIVLGYFPIPELVKLTTGEKEQEFELINKLVTNRGAFGAPSDSTLYKILKPYKDGMYRLVIFKQTPAGRMVGKDLMAFWGYCYVTKRRDQIFWETRYFQCGLPQAWNMDTRDPLEELRRGHYKDIPSGGIDRRW